MQQVKYIVRELTVLFLLFTFLLKMTAPHHLLQSQKQGILLAENASDDAAGQDKQEEGKTAFDLMDEWYPFPEDHLSKAVYLMKGIAYYRYQIGFMQAHYPAIFIPPPDL